jgi:hypothetical protein
MYKIQFVIQYNNGLDGGFNGEIFSKQIYIFTGFSVACNTNF